MSGGYDAPLISKLLRAMPSERLAAITAQNFQTWPAERTIRAPLIDELIRNERANRRLAR